MEYMRSRNKPLAERRLLMTFHGSLPGAHDAYGDCAVRRDLAALAAFGPHVDVGGFVDDYLDRKGDAIFCLVPAGTSPWTNLLYESAYAGCIPVILSDSLSRAAQIQSWRNVLCTTCPPVDLCTHENNRNGAHTRSLLIT